MPKTIKSRYKYPIGEEINHIHKGTGKTANFVQRQFAPTKNLGRLWLAYTELQGNFYMLQLKFVDCMHFTQPKSRNQPRRSIM